MWKIKLILLLLSASIYSHASVIDVDNYQALASDKRAYRVGEPVVILVVESTNAESTAATGVKKGVDIRAGVFDTVASPSVGLDLSGSGEGSGQTIRQGRATTQLSATIAEILSNDLYRVSGEQTLVINGEKQKVTLSGIVRARDISKSNTIMSNRLADANIEIQGDGDVSDAQKQSIFYKVFQWLGIL